MRRAEGPECECRNCDQGDQDGERHPDGDVCQVCLKSRRRRPEAKVVGDEQYQRCHPYKCGGRGRRLIPMRMPRGVSYQELFHAPIIFGTATQRGGHASPPSYWTRASAWVAKTPPRGAGMPYLHSPPYSTVLVAPWSTHPRPRRTVSRRNGTGFGVRSYGTGLGRTGPDLDERTVVARAWLSPWAPILPC